jgi:hypothetical protein
MAGSTSSQSLESSHVSMARNAQEEQRQSQGERPSRNAFGDSSRGPLLVPLKPIALSPVRIVDDLSTPGARGGGPK